MATPAVDGIDLFKIAGRSISGWIPSFKMGAVSPLRQPFCSQLEERLLMWLEYHPQVVRLRSRRYWPSIRECLPITPSKGCTICHRIYL
jgi:hypothetical protein